MALLNTVIKEGNNSKIYVLERSVIADKMIFAKLLRNLNKMTEMEYLIYNNMFSNLIKLF